MIKKRGLKQKLNSQGYPNLQKRLGYSTVVLVIALIIWTVIVFFYVPDECGTEECFNNALKNCEKFFYERKGPEASWLYSINGKTNGYCEVEVKLLKINQGTIDIGGLQGKSMTCMVDRESVEYPEKDISRCSGKLKEDLQEILIERMHNYLLDNMGEIEEKFEGV